MTAEQQSLSLEPECPGYDKCPIGMCGCRWLGTGVTLAAFTPTWW